MHFNLKCLFLAVLVSSSACIPTDSAITYRITLDEGTEATIERPESCNEDITDGGGDLIIAGTRYRGKCQGAGIAPRIEEENGQQHLTFATDPSYEGKIKTRSELALTRKWFPFGKPVYIGFRIRIPRAVDRTDEFFYTMQFWQCSPVGPIGGVRMSRGHSHRINFMTRGDSRAASMASYDLDPDTWTSFVIKVLVDPGAQGTFAVWSDPDGKPKTFSGPFGYAKRGTCRNSIDPPQRFRIKFGIYKGNESEGSYEVNYDDIRIGDSFDAVSPWSYSS